MDACMLINKGSNNIIPSLSCKQFHETIQDLLSKVMMIGYCRILDVKVKAQIIFDNPTGAKLVIGVSQYLKLYKLIEPKA